MTTTPLQTFRTAPIELVTRANLGDDDFHRWRREHDVFRVRPAVYADRDTWWALPPWDRYLARVHAAALRMPRAVFARESACALLGLPVLGEPTEIHVLVRRPGAARITGDVQGHFATDELELLRADGLASVSARDTVVDIARSGHPAYALAVADAAMRESGITGSDLTTINESRVSARGRRPADWPLSRATGVPESVLESISLAAIEWLGFPAPELQVEFDLGGGAIARVDAFWRRWRVIGEADGAAKYRGDDRSMLAEKRREDALRRHVSGFARWGWDEIREPNTLGSILSDAGVPRIRQPDATRLRMLRDLLP
ncbi:hypothetical protein [Microbacterium indicum]|uniref:hypothetical protein n=1 Tax=Microbacterium indicum TaxID=358100 RepID=UPI000686E136|nr:hypothetical protein [Microbacterium indicum]